jgi:hypothetical protein
MDDFFRPFNLISLVLTLVALGLTVYFYFLALRRKEPCWAVRTIRLIQDSVSKVEGLTVAYEGTTVNNVSVSRVLLWNKGRETIRKEDISTVDPLRLRVVRGRLLKITLLEANKEANMFEALVGEDEQACISFDYVDQGQGAVFQVVHTSTDPRAVVVEGVLKGAQALRRVGPSEFITHVGRKAKLIAQLIDRMTYRPIVLIVVGVVAFVIGSLATLRELGWVEFQDFFPKRGWWFSLALMLASVAYFWMATQMTFSAVRVRGLEAFSEEEWL